MKRINSFLFILLVFSISLNANNLKEESSLIKGELENGFKYTIKKNKKPQDRAEIRLLVKVGAIEEDDDQKGVAHLVEHLAFNGTKNFAKNDLIKYLESIGVSFGGHLNASTSSTQTIYKLNIPLKDDNLEKSFLIFSDWAGRIEITQEELDKERGVVQEEARARNDVKSRLYEKARPVYFEGSKLAYRSPIGDMDVIQNISLQRVKDFYETWYRPEHMHFIIVGDIDVAKTQALIKKYFSEFKNTSQKQRESRDLKKVEKTRILILKDKELTSSNISIDFVEDYEKLLTEADFKNAIIKNVMARLVNLKASEQAIKRNPAARTIRFLNRRFTDNLEANSFVASFTGLKQMDALKELTSMIYFIDKYGFEESDFKRVISEYKVQNQELLKSLESKASNKYANEILSKVSKDDIFIDEKYKIDLTDTILKQITLDEVQKAYKDILKLKSILITYKVPEEIQVSKNRIKSILLTAKDNIPIKKKSKDLPETIEVGELKSSKIVKEVYNKKYDFYEFTLENGIKVAYKFNDYEKNKVSLDSFSKGGFSLYETKDIPNASFATSIIGQSGLDKYNILDVQKIYSNRSITLKPKITRYSEGISGSTITKDFETLLQAYYLLVTKNRFDDNILENTKQITLANLKKENLVPQKVFSNELTHFLYDGNKRFVKYTKEDIEKLNKQDIVRIFEDRFKDFNNFNFIIVGDISKQEVKKNISKYLANLPVDNRNETFNYRGIKQKKGKQTFIRSLNNENISYVSLSYSKEMPYSTEELIKLNAFKDVLNTKLRELIREEKSGVYGVSVRTSFLREPYETTNIKISFSCDPKRKDELVSYIKQALDDIKTNIVDEKYVKSFSKKTVLGLQEARKGQRFWMAQLKSHYYYNDDDLEKIDNYEKLYKSITPKDIKQTANKYLDTQDILYTELNPKN